MRKLLFILAMCMATNTFAQNNNPNNDYHPLVQEGKVWKVLYAEWQFPIPPSPMGWYTYITQSFMFEGDTIIDGKEYKKLFTSLKENPIYPNDWWVFSFMREDENKRVWEKKNANALETLLYDFSLQIGDTVPAEIGFQEFQPITIENITYKMMNNGEERKILHLSSISNWFSSNYKEFWIEGIGSCLGLLEPITGELVGGFNSLLCLHENEELIFNDNPWWGRCYIMGSLGINACDNQIHIFPNPAKDMLYIENIDKLDVNNISLINIQGQIIRQFESRATQLDVSGITSGIYFIKFSTSSGNIIQKIIINQ